MQVTLALREKFSDFKKQKSPEPGWWIFERDACIGGEAKERLVVTIAGGGGYFRLVPKVSLRFQSIAEMDSLIWHDDSRSAWHMPAGLDRALSEFSDPPRRTWEVENLDQLNLMLDEIRCTYVEKVSPIFSKLCTVSDVCVWFDESPAEALRYASSLTFAVFNLVAKRSLKAQKIAESCLTKSASLPVTENELTMKMRDQYRRACLNVIEYAQR